MQRLLTTRCDTCYCPGLRERGSDSGWGWDSFLLLVLIGVVGWFAWRRLLVDARRRQEEATPRHVLSAGLVPRWHDVPVDPAPFILAANTTHVQAPEGANGQSDQR